MRSISTVRLLSTAAFIGILVLSGCQGKTDSAEQAAMDTTPGPNELSQEEIAAGWVSLFDGKTTNGWRGYGHDTFPTKGWKVEDGDLVVMATGTEEEGFGGDIITTDSFENFELSVDFMLSDTANSGILYRVIENDDTIWQNAPEYQILDDATYIAMGGMDMTTHLTGDNYDLQSATERRNKPIGEWNTAKIVVNGAHVEHWLNGAMTVEYELWSPEWEALVAKSKFAEYPAYGRTKRGPIGLQDHGHMVRFRNIKVRVL